MKSVGSSKTGLVRKLNEDRFFMDDPLYIVTDGMGGHIGGEIASTMALDVIIAELEEKIKNKEVVTENDLKNAIIKANATIYNRIQTDTELTGMGTTAVIAYVQDQSVYWASVGDSRLYAIVQGSLQQISKDHSIVQSLVDEGKLDASEVISHPQRNLLTRAVGVDSSLEVDGGVFSLEKGDRILLCSDGLTGYVPDEEIKAIFQKENKEERILEDLIDLVYQTGAKDNVTIIIGTVE